MGGRERWEVKRDDREKSGMGKKRHEDRQRGKMRQRENKTNRKGK